VRSRAESGKFLCFVGVFLEWGGYVGVCVGG